ncbi:MAG TPA: CheR family methyltransferase [Methylomirabilota bacterium]|nr:CheR family methyltransferase [Methylomirabilota bacterium]
MSEATEPRSLEQLLEYLKETRGVDFTGYKRPSLERRIQKRLQTVGLPDYEAYVRYLDARPDEVSLLFNTILINVTSFFRDADAWQYVASEVLPLIIADTRPEGQIRVWSAGCASGQEAYSLAMLFAERLGVEVCRRRLKIYGSDVDEDALNQARHATYTAQQVQEVPGELLGRYFERLDERYIFDKELRRCVIFGRHDLTRDAPISRVNLLVCRNTLMYFTRPTQGEVLSRFHFALRPRGALFLGKAELLLTHAALFRPLDLRWRVFTKAGTEEAREPPRQNPGEETVVKEDLIPNLVLETDPVARIVVKADGALAMANERARTMFRLSRADIGKPLQALDIARRPVELRPLLDDVTSHHRAVTRKNVSWTAESGETHTLEVNLVPLTTARGELTGVHVSFTDTTRFRELQEEVEQSKRELETAYEELQSTNEELETTNEELQSTNEELETMNEELQSTNEELETINTELRLRSDELNEANALLRSILAGLDVAVIVVNSDLTVLAWNHRAEDLWGLRGDEVQGRQLMTLDIGLPVEQLGQPIRTLLAGEKPLAEAAVECMNRRGKRVRCLVTGTPLSGASGGIRGVILLIKEEPLPS